MAPFEIPSRQAPSSLFERGRNCCAVAGAGRVALLVDAAAYFHAFIQAAERATQSIVIVAWDFSSSTRLHFDDDGKLRHGPPAQLGDFLNWLARRRRDLQIRVLDWDYPFLFATEREFPPVWGFGWKPHRRVEIAYDNTHPVGGSHHQKLVVIDNAMAFIGGLDLTDRRWDTPAHRVDDSRRRFGKHRYPPFHDLMMAVDRDAARALGEVAGARWLAATGERLPPVSGQADPWPPSLPADFTDVEVAVARTLPPGAGRPMVGEVEALYLDMIGAARQRIYIENQYFTADRIGDALAARLAEPNGPEIVVVLRRLSHGWLEEHTMQLLRSKLLRRLQEADRHGHFFHYYADLDGLQPGTCIDVHAKLMIVDDEILRIGSANLSNRSMGLDSECDAAIEAGGDPRRGAAIGNFRNRLLGEHLDVAPARIDEAVWRCGSLHGAIAALGGRARTLRTFEALPDWPEVVIDLVSIADPDGPVALDRLIEEFAPPPPAAAPNRRAIGIGLFGIALAIGGLAAMWRYTPLAAYVNPELVMATARQFASYPWAPLLLVAAYTPACLIVFPWHLFTLAAVVAFGPLLGATYALCGILLASLVTYVIGRSLPGHTVRHVAGHRLNQFARVLRRRGLLAVTALRLVPLAPFMVLGMVAGAIRIKLWQFMLGSLVGLLPGTLAAAVFGNEIAAALEGPSTISYGLIAGIVLVVVALSLLVRHWLVKASRSNREERA